MIFEKITTKDNERYLEHLRKCKEIPSNVAPGYVWGSLEFLPFERAYEDGLCWQKGTEREKECYYPPLGDWDSIDWISVFEKNIHPGDTFCYVPEYLKNLWEKAMPGHFEVETDRGDWDYIYDLSSLYYDLDDEKRLVKKFNELYTVEFEEISSENVAELLAFAHNATRLVKEKHPNDDFTELDADDRALERILKNWNNQDDYGNILMKVDGKIISFMIWNEIDERVIALFNKNNYEYKGVMAAVFSEMCRRNLVKGKKYLNYTYDMGIEGLRKAKLERKPIKLLEKYTMTWK